MVLHRINPEAGAEGEGLLSAVSPWVQETSALKSILDSHGFLEGVKVHMFYCIPNKP